MSIEVELPEPKEKLPSPRTDRGRLHWISSVDHKQIGIMYLWMALLFFIIGGLEAMLIRAQLALPNNYIISPEVYSQVFTMHGTTMIFLALMPVLLGLGVYFIPLMIGANEMAFPRLNAFSFWITFLGGTLLYFSFFAGGAPNAGWFNYAPLNEKVYTPNVGVDYYTVGLILTGIGSIGTALNFAVTILSMRAKQMSLKMMPMFVWMTLINSFLIMAAFPLLNSGLVMLLIDRQLNALFFLPSAGGSATLWQHFFWSFGHPEVYILILPAFGIISEVIPVFSRKPLFGYAFVVVSGMAIGLLSFGVWMHHMFAVGYSNTVNGFFGAASLLIGIPTGIKVINWLGTLYKGKIRFTTSMLFSLMFLINFTIGGLSGISFAIVPIDWQLTDSYYVVAHLHYVFLGGTVFAAFAGIFYWFPKITGRKLSEKLGKWQVWTFVTGFNMTFLVQHFLGILGMPRRVYTFFDLPYWTSLNLISSAGAVLMFGAVGIFLWNIYSTLRQNTEMTEYNPWHAWTLEWATTSPPTLKNFEDLPPIHSRRPLWDMKHPNNKDKRLN
ncbi:MAG: cbb3-type cytochrome c oxidase subunit I [Salinimicrobium sp.]